MSKKKAVLEALFFEKILVLTDFDQMLTPLYIHHWKAMDLGFFIVFKKNNFLILQSVRFLLTPWDRLITSFSNLDVVYFQKYAIGGGGKVVLASLLRLIVSNFAFLR